VEETGGDIEGCLSRWRTVSGGAVEAEGFEDFGAAASEDVVGQRLAGCGRELKDAASD
jgi:hypothetical protein